MPVPMISATTMSLRRPVMAMTSSRESSDMLPLHGRMLAPCYAIPAWPAKLYVRLQCRAITTVRYPIISTATHFFDPHGSPPKSRRDLLRWYVDRHWRGTKAKWPAWAPSPYADRPPARVEGAAWRICYVGHASFLIQTAGLNILLDPVWSRRASPFRFAGPKRVNDPGIAFEALPPIDVVLVSHGHYDHLDLATLSRLAAAHRARVVTPLGNDAIMRNHDPRHCGRGLRLGRPGRAWRRRRGDPRSDAALVGAHLSDRNKALWASFVIETPGGRIYFVADSGYGDGRTSARRASATARSASPSCRSAPTSRAGSCATST